MAKLLSVPQVAELLDISTKTVHRWIGIGKLKAEKAYGNYLMIDARTLRNKRKDPRGRKKGS